MTITFQVHKLTGSAGMHGEDVSLLDFGYYSLAGAQSDLDDLRKLHPEAEFKLVVLGATHLPHSESSMGALCGATDGPLTEGDARDEIAAVTCPVCREVYEARVIELSHKLQPWRPDDLTIEFLTSTFADVPFCRECADWHTPDLEHSSTSEVELDAPIPSFGIQSIETGIVFARQGASSAVEAERLFRADNPEYDRPGLIRAVPGYPHDAELGRSPLIERESTLKETAAALARQAEAKVEETISHLERAFELADRDLTAAKDAEDPILIALRTSIVDATGRSLAEQRTLLAQYRAVQ